MHAVVRRYTGVSSLIDEMTQREGEVREVLGAVPGFSAYYALRDGDALTTITVCTDRVGTEQSTQAAANWVRENLPELTASAPQVTGGEVFINFSTN